jgi:hypothetical protein
MGRNLYTGDAVQRVAVNVAVSQTDSVVAAAVPGRKLRVQSVFVDNGNAAATTVTFNTKGGGAGTPISPLISLAASGGAVLAEADAGWWETNVGEALTVNTSAGAPVGVFVTYFLV